MPSRGSGASPDWKSRGQCANLKPRGCSCWPKGRFRYPKSLHNQRTSRTHSVAPVDPTKLARALWFPWLKIPFCAGGGPAPTESPARSSRAIAFTRARAREDEGILERRNDEKLAEEPAKLFEAAGTLLAGQGTSAEWVGGLGDLPPR